MRDTYGELLEDLLSEGFIVKAHVDALIQLCKLSEGLLSAISANIFFREEELTKERKWKQVGMSEPI